MINKIHARIYRPERGWDPVPADYAQQYVEAVWRQVDEAWLDALARRIGGFEGKEVLDLGGGPGQYSVAFTKRGASVTWLDVSRNYLRIAQEKAKEAGVEVTFVLGYMDEAMQILRKQFDFVFNRICFCYSWNDASFVDIIYQLVRPGGYAYIETNNSSFGRDKLSPHARFRTWLNAALRIKIGHPHPPRGRIPMLFLRYPIKQMVVEYPGPHIDRIFVQRAEE
ncbi:Ubiquinone biosynthesis O-methyltransferase [bacterium HR16]|nr:Ubiquinone biosynthesis O-methyltransferase [bacterium HR16]